MVRWPKDLIDGALQNALTGEEVRLQTGSPKEAQRLREAIYRRRARQGAALVTVSLQDSTVVLTLASAPKVEIL